jgi:uncharacterized protein
VANLKTARFAVADSGLASVGLSARARRQRRYLWRTDIRFTFGIDMARTKVFRDPVHRNIQFDRRSAPDSLALSLVDATEVQRLRHIRQLALANFVYHGAEHSRFSHTLGVAHLAKRLYRAACANASRPEDDTELAIVLASAVVHDIGHPPFSHAVESILDVDHEEVTAAVLRGDTEVNKILLDHGGTEFVERVAAHVTGESDEPTAGLISSQLDADRLDYVLRDGYHAGVPNAHYDLERIVQMVSMDDSGLLWDDRAKTAIEGYFIARYHLYLQLYYHKTNRAAEVVLSRLLKRAAKVVAEDGHLEIDGDTAQIFGKYRVGAAAKLTDHDLWSAFRLWRSHDDPILRDLSNRLYARRLFKSIDIRADNVQELWDKHDDLKALARSAGFDPEYYIVVDKAKDTPYKLVGPTTGDDPATSVRLVNAASGSCEFLEHRSGLTKQLQDEAYQLLRLCLPAELKSDAIHILTG